MKNIILLFFFITSCSVTKNNEAKKYKVIKVKEEKSWCIVYLQRHKKIYKVFSKYETETGVVCTTIKQGAKYSFSLINIKDLLPLVNGTSVWVPGYTGCYDFDEISVCVEPQNDIWDLYIPKELNGKYYCRQCSKRVSKVK